MRALPTGRGIAFGLSLALMATVLASCSADHRQVVGRCDRSTKTVVEQAWSRVTHETGLGVAAQTTAAATCDTDDDTVSAEDIPAIVTRDGERVVTAYSAALTSLGWEKRYSNPIGQPSVGPGQLDLGISQLCYVRADTELLLYGQLFIESTGAAGLGYTFRVTAARSNKWDLCGS